jgi:hypothetical protein
MSDEAAVAKDMSAGAHDATQQQQHQPPPRAAASSEDAAASAPNVASEPTNDKDDEREGAPFEKEALVSEKKLLQQQPPADGSVSAEHSLDEKTPGAVDGAPATLDLSAPLVEEKKKENDAAGEADEGEQEGSQYLTGLPRLLLGFGLCVTTFLIGLDQV